MYKSEGKIGKKYKKRGNERVETAEDFSVIFDLFLWKWFKNCDDNNGFTFWGFLVIRWKYICFLLQKQGGEGSSYPPTGCTLPRQHWPTYSGAVAGVRHHQPLTGPSSYPVTSLHHHSHPHLQQTPPPTVETPAKPPVHVAGEEEHATAETPLMVTKRESTVWLVTKL